MVSSKTMISALGLGAAMLAPSASAQINQDSIARCTFNGRGIGGSQSAEVAVTVVETVTAYVCNSPGVVTEQANATAFQVANATAFAIASVTAQCIANGRASFRLNGRSLVEAEAVAIANSVVSLVLESDACGTCSIATELFAEAYTEIVLQASALAQANLEGDSTRGMPAVAIANDIVEDIINASAIAYASVLGTVQAAVGQGCNATALFSVGDLGQNGGVCAIDVTAANNSVSMNALSETIVDIEAMGCNAAIATTNINVTAEAIASAQAVALAQISTSCVIAGDAQVCAFSEAEVNATANATAEAFGFLYAAAISTCNPPTCMVDTNVLVEAVSFVLSFASARAVLNQCSDPMASVFNRTVFQEQIQEATLTALTTIIANVTVINGQECILDIPEIVAAVTGNPVVTTTRSSTPPPPPPPPPMSPPPPPPPATVVTNPGNVVVDPVVTPPPPPPPAVVTTDPGLPNCAADCVGNNRRCFGTASPFSTTPARCCNSDYVCITRNARFSQCRLATRAIPRGWDGTIVRCNPV